jgi:predicted MFS family arabinose efflux permease
LTNNIARWIEMVVVVWIVLELTDSPFLVGVLGTCRFSGMLLGPFCGAIADRFNRRNILITVQTANALALLAVTLLSLTARLQVWHLFALATIGGLNHAFDFSVRFVLAADIVEPPDLNNATSLLFVASSSTSVIGALIGGGLFEQIGESGSFMLILTTISISVLALVFIRLESPVGRHSNAPALKDFIDGLRYIRNDRGLFALILIAALMNLLVFPCWFTLVPIFGRSVFRTGASGIGQLMAAIGLGTLFGSFMATSLSDLRSRGGVLVVLLIAWPLLFVLFAFVRWFYLSLVLLAFMGLAQGMSIALIQILILTWSAETMRGRVAGARAFAISTLIVGNLMTGSAASLVGAPLVIIINCSASILITIFIALWAPALARRT